MLPVVYNPHYIAALPEGHRFPMLKFRLIYEALLAQGIVRPQWVHTPGIASRRLLASVHTRDYIDAFCDGRLSTQAMRRIGLPWSQQLVLRTRTAVSGTLLTAVLALEHGLACNTAGGTHHAFADHGSGFCIFNDLAVTARVLVDRGLVSRVLIVDLDVHQGDGTARIFEGDPRITTFSMHCRENFPFAKQKSDIDVAIPAGTGDDDYLRLVRRHLFPALEAAQPDLVLYDAGVDPHRDDALGKLELTDTGLYQRDRLVLQACMDRGIPVATVVGGGYSRDLKSLAWRHTLVHRAAVDVLGRIAVHAVST